MQISVAYLTFTLVTEIQNRKFLLTMCHIHLIVYT